MTNQRPLPRRLLVTLAVLAGTAGLTAGATAAASSDSASADTATVDSGVACEQHTVELTFDQLDEADQSALIELMTADANAEKAALDAAGVAYVSTADPATGVEWPSVDPADAAANDALATYNTTSAFERVRSNIASGNGAEQISFDGDDDFGAYFASLDETQQSQFIADTNAAADELAAEMDASGTAYTLQADPVTGVEWPVATAGQRGSELFSMVVFGEGCDDDGAVAETAGQ